MPGYRKLGVKTAHRQSMLRNLVTDLFRYGRIQTTDCRAKEARREAEKLITLAKKNDLHARRQALAYIYDESVSGYFDGGTISSGTTLRIKLTDNKTLSDTYRKALTQACVDIGFTKATDYSAKLTINGKVLTVGTLGTSVNIIYKDA